MAINDFAVARAVHVLAVVWWIGGVAFVTATLLPACRSLPNPTERIAAFQHLEHRFATQARWATLLAGASGFWLVHRFNLWGRFADLANGWWLAAMVAVWLVFSVMLFLLEPFVLPRRFAEAVARAPADTFRHIERAHRILLLASLITVAGAVAGSHGGWAF
ncbi:hypothetical protein [Zoogloea sp.]|uniref:hypothetical protein n=1 Tax=Zoogloea sp. TaxID=49181 RepID=UPI001A41E519|nr:hypothetical protein [Zoogloeaceae bacterium]